MVVVTGGGALSTQFHTYLRNATAFAAQTRAKGSPPPPPGGPNFCVDHDCTSGYEPIRPVGKTARILLAGPLKYQKYPIFEKVALYL